jgi:hypothetical protein
MCRLEAKIGGKATLVPLSGLIEAFCRDTVEESEVFTSGLFSGLEILLDVDASEPVGYSP